MIVVDLRDLGLDRGGHLLVKRALGRSAAGDAVAVRGSAPGLAVDLKAWCRSQGHEVEADDGGWKVRRSATADGRWRRAEATGDPSAVVDDAPAHWGLAARGATVEAGAPAFDFPLHTRDAIWADEAAALYAQAAAAQWDPATAIPWQTPIDLPDEVEDAIVQILTYLIENETAALVVPARFAAQVHPHFREVMQLLAIQAADEARHIEVFTRRALLRRSRLALSTVGGQASLKTLVDEADFALASFLLSVLGEGSFLNLLRFLHEHAPDPVTQAVMRLTAQDEARHVAFGIAHLTRHVEADPGFLTRLASAVERRHDALAETAGLNEEVFDALVLLAAGAWQPEAIERGWDAVQTLQRAMEDGRRQRLVRIGFAADAAAALSALHTRNFM